MKRKPVYTTGEAADLCHLSQQTIIRCFDDGQLGGFRVPGSKFRRIPHHELIRFMDANEIPRDGFGDGTLRVLLVDDDPDVIDVLAEALAADERFEVCTADSGYGAGLVTAEFHPAVVVFNCHLPDISAEAICRVLREHAEYARVRVVAIAAALDAGEGEALKAVGVSDVLRKPLTAETFMERLTSPSEA